MGKAGTSHRDRLIKKHDRPASSPEESLQDIKVIEMTNSDANLKRMSRPVLLNRSKHRFLTRRFAVKQRDAKGLWKIRCIDDFHESLVNDACGVHRRIRMGRHHDLDWVARRLHRRLGHRLKLLKSDFRAAYRSCPILSEDLKFSHILIRGASGELLVSEQFAMPFGAVGAVYAWDRLGSAITAILIDHLLVPCIRYVDDLFWVDFEETSLECREMVMEIVGLLGFTLEPDKTPLPSDSLDILGITTSLKIINGDLHLTYVPDSLKVSFWLEDLVSIQSSGFLLIEPARQIIGRLSFAAWSVWGPIASARLRPLYTFLMFGGGRLSKDARKSLEWWTHRLRNLQPKLSILKELVDEIVIIYTDAEGNGGLGGIFTSSGLDEWFSCTTPASFIGVLQPRKTQIFALESLAVLISVLIWAKHLQGRRVIFFIDNTSALGCLRKGSSSCSDVHSIITRFWDLAAQYHFSAFLRWVPSKLNISDRPSRGVSPIIGLQIPCRFRRESLCAMILKDRA